MKKLVGIILIVFGMSIMISAVYMKHYGQLKQKVMMKNYEKSIKTEKDNSPSDKYPQEFNGAVGIIRIPKIDLKVAIGEGVDMNTLKYSVGHFSDTVLPGEKGNCCLAGHRSYTYSQYFNRLDEVGNGDEIYIKTKQGEFKYVVYEKIVVKPSDYQVLKGTNETTLTLVTCTPIKIATHRLIIKARIQ